MTASPDSTNNNDSPDWFVYIVRCSDGTYYTGITTDVERRIAEHNGDRAGAKYTRARRPVQLVHLEQVDNRSAAAKREYAIRRLSVSQKRALMNERGGEVGGM